MFGFFEIVFQNKTDQVSGFHLFRFLKSGILTEIFFQIFFENFLTQLIN